MNKKWMILASLVMCAIVVSFFTIDCRKDSIMAISEPSNPEAQAFYNSNKHIVLAYFPTWGETYTTQGQGSPLRNIPSFINCIFIAFAKPDMTYQKGSYELFGTGIALPYDGCMFAESIAALKKKGITIILSLGGGTYQNWGGL